MDKTRAFHAAVRSFALGTDALAAAMGISTTTLNHKANPHDAKQFFSPEEGIELQQLTGNHGAVQVEAAALGYVLIKRPDLGAEGSLSFERVNTTVREFSEFLASSTSALADGAITGNELRRVEAECTEAIAAVQDLLALIRSMHEQGRPAAERGAP